MADEGDKPPALAIARSLGDARKGEVLVLSGSGRVVSKAATRVRGVATGVVAGGAVGAIAILGQSLLGIPYFALGVMVVFGVVLTVSSVRWAPVRRALALMAAGQPAAARPLLEKADRPGTDPRRLATVIGMRAHLARLEGKPEEALGHYERALEIYRRMPRHEKNAGYWNVYFGHAYALVVMGRLDDVSAMRRELERAPRSTYFDLWRGSLDLALAFHGG